MKHVIAIAIIGLMIFSACDSEIKETSAKTVSNESENKVVVTTTNDEALITLPSENGFPDSTFSAQREDNTSP